MTSRSRQATCSNTLLISSFSGNVDRDIYTTNAIESLNSVIRHAIKKRKVFPIDESVKKVMRLAIQSASQKWTMPLQDWRIAMSRFIIEFGDCCGQLKLATALEFFQYRFSDSFGGNPPLYSCGLSAL